MKNKVFIKILLLIVFLSNIQLSFSQVSADLMKYWYYRNRLKYFVVNGNKVGEGQIVCIRNRMGCDPRIDNPDGKGGNVDWGQPGKHDGYYIGVLATEYYLLEQNGQDTDAAHTLTELQNALTTFIVNWDEAAKQYWGRPSLQNGFFMRGNTPIGFFDTIQKMSNLNTTGNGFTANGKSHLSLLNKGLDTTDTWNSHDTTFGHFPRGHPGYGNYTHSSLCFPPPCGPMPQAMSQDEAIIMLLGCSLAAELADGTVKQMAKTECDLVLTYMLNCQLQNGPLPFTIFNPNGSIPSTSLGPSTFTHGPGLCESGFQITGNWKYRIWHDLWRNPAQDIAWMADINFGWGNNDLTATCLAMGNYASWRIKKITHNNNWDTFYLLLWEVLNDNRRGKNDQKELLKKTTDQLDNAPCEGPYCYLPGVHAGGGWASDYKWSKDKNAQDNGTDFTGNYNGADYMLLYNLYHIMTRLTSPFYVSYINRNLVDTVKASTNFIGYSTITSKQIIEPSSAPIVNYKAGDSIDLKKGFHALHGSTFHAYIGTVDCSDAQSITPYYDSLISAPKIPYDTREETDTLENNNIYLPCPNDTLKFTSKLCDTCSSFYWDFGNGQTSTLQYPKVFYANPGTYNVKIILVDTSGVADTALFTVTAPDCRIHGFLNENPSCGGAPIAGVSLYLTYNGNHVNSVTPAVTQSDGSFQFNSTELYQLFPDTNYYTITSSSGIAIEEGVAKTINDWMDQSPLSLYYATTVSQKWVARYNGISSLNDEGSAIDLQGNIYVTGFTTSSSTGSDMLTIMYDSLGSQKWAVPYDGNNTSILCDTSRAITVDASGNAYVTGVSCFSDYNVINTVSYAKDGTKRWVQQYPTTSCALATANCILQDHAGNIIVGGTSALCSGGKKIFNILKYKNTGSFIRSTYYTGPATVPNDNLTALIVDTKSNIYATGYSQGIGTNYDMVTVKFDSSGHQLWVARYNNVDNGNDYTYSNAIDNSGNIIVTGYSHRISGKDEIVTINYNPVNGDTNWVRVYNSDTHDYAYKALCDNANNIYICGYSGDVSSSGLLALKYDTNGNLLWNKYSLTSNNFIFKSAALDIAGDLYITGTTKNQNGYTDITTQKINSDSSIQWTIPYNGSANNNDVPSSIMVSAKGNVYVNGYSIGSGTGYDFVTLKYTQCLSTANLLAPNPNSNSNDNISPNTISAASGNVSVKVIPNPNNGNMQIVYEIPENTIGTFEVYNLIGNELFSYPLIGGKNTFSISRSDLNPGIYFYRVTSGNNIIAKDKIVVIK